MSAFDRLFHSLIKQGELTVITASGRKRTFGRPAEGRPSVTIRFTDRLTPLRIVRNPSLGAGEAYMNGTLLLEQGDIYDLLDLVTGNRRFETRGGDEFGKRSRLSRNSPATKIEIRL